MTSRSRVITTSSPRASSSTTREVVYHRNREELAQQGILFCDMDTALREYPDLVKRYFGTIIPPGDNKFAAFNTSVWSGGSFIYVPPGVECEMPLQAYFRINAENAGQFERTLIIADEGSQVHYIEGCSAPVYTSDSLHSAVVEIVVKPSAPGSPTRRSRTGAPTSTTSSPSGRGSRPRGTWNGSTATSDPS